MNAVKIEVEEGLDVTGAPYEFTWDLFPLVDAEQTLHLNTNGLPVVGSQISNGMIVVGRIGNSHSFDPSAQPTSLEIHTISTRELREKYGHMWENGSLYAHSNTTGTVVDAHFENVGECLRAVVWIVRDEKVAR
jgi:hypothetical protein